MNMELRTAMRRTGWIILALAAVAITGSRAWAVLPQPGDVVHGLSNNMAALTIELVRGSAAMNGGSEVASPWTSESFIQSVEFDNFGGIAHNASGNLLGVNFGATSAVGGTILSYGTTGTDLAPAGQLLFNMDPANQFGPILPNGDPTRIGGLSVSPDNTKIALTGYDTGRAIVFDYTAGNTMGTGTPALANARESGVILPVGTGVSTTHGTAWLDNDTVITFGATGDIHEVDVVGAALNTTLKTTVTPPAGATASRFTSLAYNPAISPYVFASHSSFTSPTTFNTLFVLDPANNYSTVKQIDLSASLQTAREMALDKNGNLFIGAFGGVIEFIPASMILNPATLADNSTVDWYDTTDFSNFSGHDIGFGTATALVGDFNGDEVVDAADYTTWRDGLGTTFDLDDYNDWKGNFGAHAGSGSGGLAGGAVPEPMSAVLVVMGLIGLWLGRRGGRV